MAEPIVIPAGGGEVIGDAPDRTVLVLSECDELHATWSRFGPGRDGAGLHIHYHHTDLFYVLEGELTVKVAEDEAITAGAGTLVTIPPMVVHGFRNASDADVKYLNLHTPGCDFIPYMRGIRDKQPFAFDQHDYEGVEGLLPASEIAVGAEEFVLEGDGQREVLLCDIEAVAISEVVAEQGAPASERARPPRPRRVVLRARGRARLHRRQGGGRRGHRDLGAGAGRRCPMSSASRPGRRGS